MGDHGFDALVVAVGRRFRIEQDVFVVEDVETLVLHRPHVEVGDRHDVEHVEIVFAAEPPLVPAHGAFHRIHRVAGAPRLTRFGIDTELHQATACRSDVVRQEIEFSGDKREQVGRLGEGIVPNGEMPAGIERAALDEVAVRQEHGRIVQTRLDAHPVDRERIRPIVEIADAPEAFGLALRAPDAVGAIQPHQLGVRGRIEHGGDRKLEPPRRRQAAHRQGVRLRLVATGVEVRAVDLDRGHRKFVPVETQRGLSVDPVAPLELRHGQDFGSVLEQADQHLDAVHREVGRSIVLEPSRLPVVGSQHCGSSMALRPLDRPGARLCQTHPRRRPCRMSRIDRPAAAPLDGERVRNPDP